MSPATSYRLELVTVLRAPRERVFRSLVQQTSLAQWWGSTGFTLPEAELDLRVGGRYRFGMKPPEGQLFHLTGTFLAVDPPRYLAYTFVYEEPDPDDRETVVKLSLAAADELTELTLSHGEFVTEARLSLHRNGWTESLHRLEKLIDSGG